MKLFGKSKKVQGLRAVSFHDDGLRAVHIDRQGGRPMLLSAFEENRQGAQGVTPLSRLAQKWQGERCDYTTALGAPQYRFLIVDKPNVPQPELRAAVSWLIRDMVDFPLEEATIDVLAIPDSAQGLDAARSMVAVVAHSEPLRRLQAQFEESQLALKMIDIPEMAQRNLATLLESDGRGVALLSFDERGGLLTFSAHGELYHARRIEVSAELLTAPNEARRLAAWERVALEIQRSIDYFLRQFHTVQLSRLALAPLASHGEELAAFLRENIELAVERFDLSELIDLSAAPEVRDAAQQQRFLLPVGLALRVEETVL
jgi:MSHA biogenesis protein MshI